MKFNNWKNAILDIKKNINNKNIKAISFDVFDTLLIRKTNPETILDSIATEIAIKYNLDKKHIIETRHKIWKELTTINLEKNKDCDAHCKEIWKKWIYYLNLEKKENIYDTIKKIELDKEYYALTPNIELLNFIKNNKHKIHFCITTDMYLGSEEIQYLLNKHGFDFEKEQIFSSGEIGFQKRTGNLFPYIIRYFEQKNINKENIIHIGDNASADYNMPIKHNIKSYLVEDKEQNFIRKNLIFYKRLSQLGEPFSKELECDNSVLLSYNYNKNIYHYIGYNAFASIYVNFVNKIIDYVIRNEMEEVLFFAREGVLLKQLYDARKNINDEISSLMPNSGYLPISRLSSMKATMNTFGKREFNAVQANSPYVTISRLLKILNLNQDIISKIAFECGLKNIEKPLLFENEITQKIISHPIVIESSNKIFEENSNGFDKYLRKNNIDSKNKIAVVDMGWGAQIQEYLCKFINDKNYNLIPENIHGLYFGINNKAHERIKNGLNIQSLGVDEQDKTKSGLGVFNFLIGFEIATRAIHGTVTGYENNGMPTIDIKSSGRFIEEDDDFIISSIQEGILDYAKKWFPLSIATNINIDKSMQIAILRAEKTSYIPEKHIALPLLSINNVANLGSEEKWQMGDKISLLHPKKSFNILKNTFWQEGTASSYFGYLGIFSILSLKYLKMLKNHSNHKTNIKNEIKENYMIYEKNKQSLKQNGMKDEYLYNLGIRNRNFYINKEYYPSYEEKNKLFKQNETKNKYIVKKYNILYTDIILSIFYKRKHILNIKSWIKLFIYNLFKS